jgi:leader peptidase (prepilin peptidase) / N-methyltransferase
LGVSLGRAGTRSADVRRWDRWTGAPRVPVVGATLAVTAGLVAATIVADGSIPAAVTVGALVPAAAVDVRERRLPDRLVAFGGLVLLTATLVTGSVAVHAVLAGVTVLAGPILLLHLVSPAAMGFGDVKLAVVLGAAIGTWDWRLALAAMCLASAFGAALGLLRRSDTVAFGAHLVAASVVALLAAPHVIATSAIGAVMT